MPTCYILIGPMGCGKSTWRQANLASLNDPVVISTDDCFDEVAAKDGITYAEAWERYNYDDMVKKERVKLVRACIAGRDIIIDQTNCTVGSRSLFRPNLPPTYKVVAVVFGFDRDTIHQRVRERGKATGKWIPHSVVEDKMNSFEYPLPGEFDEVVRVPYVA
jgi:predicted ABC-type ATPase